MYPPLPYVGSTPKSCGALDFALETCPVCDYREPSPCLHRKAAVGQRICSSWTQRAKPGPVGRQVLAQEWEELQQLEQFSCGTNA